MKRKINDVICNRKKCSKCEDVKTLDSFYVKKDSKDGYMCYCKICRKQINEEYHKINPNYNQDYYFINKEEIRKYQNTNSKESYRLNKKRYRGYQNKYNKKHLLNNPLYKFNRNIHKLFLVSFKNKGFKKNNRKTEEILGCTIEFFYNYIETKFESWMSWENRGLYNGELNYGWDLDHIKPMATAITEADVLKLNHYTNLQPLCGYINRYVKKDNY